MDNNNFFSIDKLVEFGLGVAVAQQMVGVMNQSLKNMYIPGSYMDLSQTLESIYVAIDNRPVGPLSTIQFSNLVNSGKINKDTLVWMPNMTGWKSLLEVPQLLKIIALTPPPIPQN